MQGELESRQRTGRRVGKKERKLRCRQTKLNYGVARNEVINSHFWNTAGGRYIPPKQVKKQTPFVWHINSRRGDGIFPPKKQKGKNGMKEKNLTDEEIVKALEWCCYKASKQGCVGCAYCETVNDDIRCRMKKMLCDTLDLIHRLQGENEKMRNAKIVYETVDYCAEDLKKAQEEIERLKKANEKLYYNGLNENTARLGDMRTIERLEDKNAELQKQVDELQDNLSEKQNALWDLQDDFENLLDEGKNQAVKDTAKEIYSWLKEHTFDGAGWELVKAYFRETGVEVE